MCICTTYSICYFPYREIDPHINFIRIGFPIPSLWRTNIDYTFHYEKNKKCWSCDKNKIRMNISKQKEENYSLRIVIHTYIHSNLVRKLVKRKFWSAFSEYPQFKNVHSKRICFNIDRVIWCVKRLDRIDPQKCKEM